MELLGEPGGGLLCWGPCRLWKESSGDGHLHGVSVGQPGVGSSNKDFEMWLREALEVERLSLWKLCEGNLEGGLPCWGPWRVRRSLWRCASLFTGAPLGNPEEGLSTGDFERWMKGTLGMELFSLSFWRGSVEWASGGSSFTGDPGIYV
jgi:hypothetical protein